MIKKDDASGGAHAEGPLHIVEKRGFANARCECGWQGPARRSRKKARDDAAAHLDERCKAFKRKK
jgi:hypothetical protein